MMVSKEKKKVKKNKVVWLVIFILLLCLLLGVYVVPRVIYLHRIGWFSTEKVEMQKIELSNDYDGDAIDLKNSVITFSIPIESTDNIIKMKDFEDEFGFWGNGYTVILMDMDLRKVNTDKIVPQEYMYLLLNTETLNEYFYNIMESDINKPAIFDSLEDFKAKSIGYYLKFVIFSPYGSKFATYEDDEKAFVAVFNRKLGTDSVLTIHQFDKGNGYDLEYSIEIRRDNTYQDFTSEEIQFILNSIKLID